MSEALKGALIIGQSGGPSSVINSSAYGCIRTALDADCITKVYGAYHGIKGVLNDELLCMDEEDRAELDRLPYTPSSALGSMSTASSPPASSRPTRITARSSSRISARSSSSPATTI